MTDKQKAWLIKVEKEIRDKFPGDPWDNETSEELLKVCNGYIEKANGNETVKRWMLGILKGYSDRNAILEGRGRTSWESEQAYMEKYGYEI